MAKHKISEAKLSRIVRSVIREAIDGDGVSGDYQDDMKHLADVTGEEMDDDFLDSVAYYDTRDGDDGPVYPDRKKSEMDADWRDIDDQAKDIKARYGKNAQALDNLNAFSDTVDQYLNDVNDNVIDDPYALNAKWALRQLESVVKRMARKVVNEMNSYEQPNDFSRNSRVNAHKFAHGGVDAEWARRDQDKQREKEDKFMRDNTKRAMDAADKRPLHRKGSLNRAFKESKANVREARGRYAFRTQSDHHGWDSILINDLNEIKDCKTPGVYYWDVNDYNAQNFSDPKSLIAWGGENGYWANFLEREDVSPEAKEYVLSKKKDIKVGR